MSDIRECVSQLCLYLSAFAHTCHFHFTTLCNTGAIIHLHFKDEEKRQEGKSNLCKLIQFVKG